MEKAFAVSMAGGKGERFWPLSTSEHPKQVLSVFTGRPLVAASVDRALSLLPPERVLTAKSAIMISATDMAIAYFTFFLFIYFAISIQYHPQALLNTCPCQA